jgi:hypothetical protein
MADLPNTLPEIADTILDVIGNCEEANKAQDAAEYEDAATGALFHWQSAIHHIIDLHPDLFPLNNLLSLLNSDKDDFQLNYRDNLLDLYKTCYAYQPFEALLQGEFGTTLDDFREEMQSDVETDDGMEN